MHRILSGVAVVLGCTAAACTSTTDSPVTRPTGVKAAITGNTISLTWNPVSKAVSYKVYMASTSGVTRLNVNTLPGNMTHTDLPGSFPHPAGLNSGTKWYLVVTAVHADSSESTESCEVSAVIATSLATSC